MGLIEQAAKRLEELRRAGVEPPASVPRPVASRGSDVPVQPESKAPQARTSRSVNLDLASLASNGFVTPANPRTRTADEYRLIKRPLISNATGKGVAAVKNGNLIMVTSALPAEGKTFSAINLAMSIAMEQDHTVLLVDADVARPTIPQCLGLPLEMPGLLDLVADRSRDVADVLLRTNVEKLALLPSGQLRPHSSEMLASEAMGQLVADLSARYPERIIIFDSPPLLVTTEARVLASYMGQIAFVVQADRTAQADVQRALATIEACDVKLLILNKARNASQGTYGYGYGYGHGHGN